MALRIRNLTKRLYNLSIPRPVATTNFQAPPPLFANASKSNCNQTSSTPANSGFFRRFLAINHMAGPPEFLTLPVGDKMRERLKGIDGIILPLPVLPEMGGTAGLTVDEARRILRVAQMERVKARLRDVPSDMVSYQEFRRICADACQNEIQGSEFAEVLDESGNVIVFGNVVLLRPEQVAKSMESLISQTMALPNNPRKQELEQMKRQKAEINKQAHKLVQKELYFGLGLILVQTLGFIRLTFWELSWDVMEPICFFVTSLHFALAYAFFLRTSIEPSFQGYFHHRFKAKQRKLTRAQNFDVEKYKRLCDAFYPK